MWMIWIIAALLLVIFCQNLTISRKDDELLTLKKVHRSDLEKQKADYEARMSTSLELVALRNQLNDLKKEKSRLAVLIAKERVDLRKVELVRIRIKHAPLDISFSEDRMPVYWKPDPGKPYGDYTVYFSMKSGIYHVDRFCGSYHSRTDHIFNVIGNARPCKKCAEGFFDFTTVPEWFSDTHTIKD